MNLAHVWQNAIAGDQDSSALLFEAYRPYLLAIANATLHRDVRSKMAASDIVQDTIMSAHLNFPEFVGTSEESLRSWLRHILKNQLVDCTRAFRGTTKRDVRREVRLDPQIETSPRCGETPLSIFLQNEQADRLQREIDLLPEIERQVVELYHTSGLSFTEIADRLNCSRETARRKWSRALQMLAIAFGDDSCRRP